jgi:hypothetical protein
MSYKEMNVCSENTGDARKVAWESEVNMVAPGNSDAIIIPDEIIFISTTMSFTEGGSGKVQVTTDRIAVVKEGLGITWVDSWWGETSDTYCDVYFPVTAIRAVQINAGTMRMTIRCQ